MSDDFQRVILLSKLMWTVVKFNLKKLQLFGHKLLPVYSEAFYAALLPRTGQKG